MSQFKSYREGSRTNWGTNDEGGLSRDQIALGCQLRIADSLEAIAKSKTDLERDNRTLNRIVDHLNGENEHLRRSRAAYKAQVTKLKGSIRMREAV